MNGTEGVVVVHLKLKYDADSAVLFAVSNLCVNHLKAKERRKNGKGGRVGLKDILPIFTLAWQYKLI